ncbi:UPF0575 protein C19orf67 homolog isoform X1 [Hyperolius riggenbachi]|uniref:UPF0575 protein C19orf67 homolog isoform X1 n=1 Tax=Hyperolius riggenbachi TaxID=752182 RepID=UPI0035A38253
MASCGQSYYVLGKPPDEETICLLRNTLSYLLGKIEDLQSCLPNIQNLQHAEESSAAFPALMTECELFLVCLESSARSTGSSIIPVSEILKSQLLDVSELLVKHLEHLSLQYMSAGLISLDDTDPSGMSAVLCGRFCLAEDYQISIFRYFMQAQYSPTVPTLYKRLRWNIEVTAEGKDISPKYYFLCCNENAEDASEPLHITPVTSCTSPHETEMVWSIGEWVPADPAEDADIESWILCSQPTAWYQPLLIVGLQEPSHTMATNLLVQLLTGDWEEAHVSLHRTSPTSEALSPGLLETGGSDLHEKDNSANTA